MYSEWIYLLVFSLDFILFSTSISSLSRQFKFFFKTELSNIIFSKKKMITFQENAKMLK